MICGWEVGDAYFVVGKTEQRAPIYLQILHLLHHISYPSLGYSFVGDHFFGRMDFLTAWMYGTVIHNRNHYHFSWTYLGTVMARMGYWNMIMMHLQTSIASCLWTICRHRGECCCSVAAFDHSCGHKLQIFYLRSTDVERPQTDCWVIEIS